MGSSTVSDVPSLAIPLIHISDSVKVSHITALDEEVEAPATTETWPAMFLPKSNVTADEAENVAVPLAPLSRPSAFVTVPLTSYMATG